ncbi:ABC transporter substrate-binding protein [Roseisolibacter agri]|uniref:Branched chain amino acid ABC transporter substrate-binding protein n=1 Tax=Roseisolibacter agri TaxID=2014610 RepID=A0AA37Q771_9BACT|nr:ABC transporter substrate-binding protein [Roseisolibacter agri]GLC27829.1 branched chain amino acid ABC transporter substrate-binding protein [Roseisolibacter agri]
MSVRSRGLALLLVLGLWGCRDASRSTIGVAMGTDGVAAARLAAADVNAAGGIGGDSLRLRVTEMEAVAAAQRAIRVADSLASDPAVVAVVGHSNSAASLAASQIYNARQLAHVAPTTTAPLFSKAGPYSFRLVPDDRRQADFLVAEIVRSGARRVAVVYVNDDYGRALQLAVRAQLDRHATPVVYEAPYLEPGDSAQLAVVARAAANARPDLLVWLGRPPQLARVLATLRPLRPALPVLGSDAVDLGPVYEQPARFSLVRFVRFVDPAGPAPSLQAFRARFVAASGHEPTAEALLAYDATMLLAAAMRDGARTRAAVRDWLADVGSARPAHQGISGPIAFDSAGDANRPLRLAEVRPDGVRAVSNP